MKRQIQLGKTLVTDASSPYVIAEIGVNHEGSMELAKQLIDLAKEGGAHAAKFQSYKAGTLASKHSPSYWDLSKEKTTSQYELFKKYDNFGEAEYRALATHCERVGIEFISTPFDDAAVEFLDPLVRYFKVASADLTNIPFLRKIAAKRKPVILSTGASRLGEIDLALATLHQAGCTEVALLHCVLNYPTPDPQAHLNMIQGLRASYPQYMIGYSDHTLPDPAMVSLTTSYLKGARILEKHFTHDKTLPGNDHYHAMTADDLKHYFAHINKIRDLEGLTDKAPIPTEVLSRKNARRSIVLARSIPEGAVLQESDLTYKRPATGISPVFWDQVIGMKARCPLEEDHVLQWNDLNSIKGGNRVVAIVQARMGSSRFPRKMMAKLAGRPLIEWIFSRVKKASEISEIFLVTSTDPANDVLEDVASDFGIRTLRGDENDVLSRYCAASRLSSSETIVRICGDNPFVAPEELDRLVRFFREQNSDYSFNHVPKEQNGYPDGFGAEIFSARILDEIVKNNPSALQREHVTSYIWDNRQAFKIAVLKAPQELSDADAKRFDIDTPADLEKLQSVAGKVGINGAASDFLAAATF